MNMMKRNVWLLAGCQALMNSGNSLLIATSALVGFKLAADKSLATLPLALQFFTSMLTTVPASFLMKAIGRRAGFQVGALFGLAGAGFATWGIVAGNFIYFLAGGKIFTDSFAIGSDNDDVGGRKDFYQHYGIKRWTVPHQMFSNFSC